MVPRAPVSVCLMAAWPQSQSRFAADWGLEMACPKSWRVEWDAHPDGTPAGHLEFTQRARARGFAMVRKASGFVVRVIPQ